MPASQAITRVLCKRRQDPEKGCRKHAQNFQLGLARVAGQELEDREEPDKSTARERREKVASISGSQLRHDRRLVASVMKGLLRRMGENDRSKAARAGRAD